MELGFAFAAAAAFIAWASSSASRSNLQTQRIAAWDCYQSQRADARNQGAS
jgi:type II secretory pathway pseudopilin PulG